MRPAILRLHGAPAPLTEAPPSLGIVEQKRCTPSEILWISCTERDPRARLLEYPDHGTRVRSEHREPERHVVEELVRERRVDVGARVEREDPDVGASDPARKLRVIDPTGKHHVAFHSVLADGRLEARPRTPVADHHECGPRRSLAKPLHRRDRHLDSAIADQDSREEQKRTPFQFARQRPGRRRAVHDFEIRSIPDQRPAFVRKPEPLETLARLGRNHEHPRRAAQHEALDRLGRARAPQQMVEPSEIVELPVAAERLGVGLGHVDDRRNSESPGEPDPERGERKITNEHAVGAELPGGRERRVDPERIREGGKREQARTAAEVRQPADPRSLDTIPARATAQVPGHQEYLVARAVERAQHLLDADVPGVVPVVELQKSHGRTDRDARTGGQGIICRPPAEPGMSISNDPHEPQFGLGKSLLFSVVLLLLVLGSAELALRTWAFFFREEIQRYDASAGTFELVPGEHRTALGRVRINPDGFVGDPLEPPGPDLWRVVAVGDSCTFGGGNEVDTYPALLEKLLAEKAPHERIEVVNAGISGLNSELARRRLESRVPELRPDVVTIYIGWNDLMKFDPLAQGERSRFAGVARAIDELWITKSLRKLLFYYLRPSMREPATGPESLTGRFAGFSPTVFEKELRAMIADVRAMNARPVVMTLPTVVRPEMSVADLERAGVVFPYFPSAYAVGDFLDLLGAYNRSIRRVAAEEGVALVDLEKRFDALDDPTPYFYDTMHTNSKGMAIIANEVAATLEREGLAGPPANAARAQ